MENLRWPVIILTAVLALALWGGVSFYHQRYLKETPLVEQLIQMEEIEQAQILREHGEAVLIISTSPSFRGSMSQLYSRVEELVLNELKEPLQIKFKDRRNQRLELFVREAAPGLYEGARLGNYRQVAETINMLKEKYQLAEVEFTVDYRRLYLQGRDGEYYLYLTVMVDTPEGGASDA
ncbi:MAG TPA: hypothetical protein GX693_03325 [Firmicutes bacterium]|nr:hypothetical protein [Bacillota bacterium]